MLGSEEERHKDLSNENIKNTKKRIIKNFKATTSAVHPAVFRS